MLVISFRSNFILFAVGTWLGTVTAFERADLNALDQLRTDDLARFPQLFPLPIFDNMTAKPDEGLTECCITAIAQWLQSGSVDTVDVQLNPRVYDRPKESPCGVSNQTSLQVSRSWAQLRCPVWEEKRTMKLRPTPGGLVSIIGVLIMLAGNIPRSFTCEVMPNPPYLGVSVLRKVYSVVVHLINAFGDMAMSIILAFGMAGPLLVNALLVVTLESRMVHYLQQKRAGGLAIEKRAKIALAVVAGELELEPALNDVTNLTHMVEDGSLEPDRKDSVSIVDRLQTLARRQDNYLMEVFSPSLIWLTTFIPLMLEDVGGSHDTIHVAMYGVWWTIVVHIAAVSKISLRRNLGSKLSDMVKEYNESRHGDSADRSNLSTADIEKSNVHSEQNLPNKASPRPKHVASMEYASVPPWEVFENKRRWILVVCAQIWADARDDKRDDLQHMEDELLECMRCTIMFPGALKITISMLTVLFLFGPCLCGWLIAQGMSFSSADFRGSTIVVYAAIQCLLLVSWTHNMSARDRYSPQIRNIQQLMSVIGKAGKKSTKSKAAVQELYERALGDTRVPIKELRPRQRRREPFHLLANTACLLTTVLMFYGAVLPSISKCRDCLYLLHWNEWGAPRLSMTLILPQPVRSIHYVISPTLYLRAGGASLGATSITVGCCGWLTRSSKRDLAAVISQLEKDAHAEGNKRDGV